MGRPKITKPLDDILREDFSYDPIKGIVYRDGREFGTYDSRGYLVGTVKRKCLKVHRLAWFLYYGDWPKYGIDHINRVKDDNRICNLRDVTQAVNLRNVGLRSNNKSGYKNVSWDKTKGKWIARKYVDGDYKFLGYFNCPTSAFIAMQRGVLLNANTRSN
jgi:hypothetical protein